ncbi:MAG: hypothetical protein JW791_00500 [Nanoarchaeota archaeon]|nr:hypothetical protein [Nanoarchaeota archaeon]
MENEFSDYYIKIGLGSRFGTELSNISYLLKELKQTRNSLNSYRQKKAELRKELYEMLISLRLNLDKLKNHLPAHEAAKLEKRIKEIESYSKKKRAVEKKTVKGKVKKAAKKEVKKEKKLPEKVKVKPEEKIDMLSSEKRELELLKQDLENISKELKKRK